ncbi:MAG: nicotinamide-nucleotide amidohydrolase family protein [Candidatus Thiodiazotropha sp. (ex Gloverina cf. vestifex)]|nr:nicotinamide-nucleotide amidohydrolase family protein [Candidatus Thiodiazotropha sp. (ex Gloverina cf. vestifex)]
MGENDAIKALTARCAKRLSEMGLRLVVAESCTGGWLAKVLTDLPGSSAWFDRGYVTYSNEAKQSILGVRSDTLMAHGAVSEETVAEMVRGALTESGADLALAVSGIAGPGGGSVEKPVGTVCFAWQRRGATPQVSREIFEGDREQVRRQSVGYLLERLDEMLHE